VRPSSRGKRKAEKNKVKQKLNKTKQNKTPRHRTESQTQKTQNKHSPIAIILVICLVVVLVAFESEFCWIQSPSATFKSISTPSRMILMIPSFHFCNLKLALRKAQHSSHK
jgi:Na+/glutamate symporter